MHVHFISKYNSNRLRGLECLVWFYDLHISVLTSVFDFCLLCHHCVANRRLLGPVVESAIVHIAIFFGFCSVFFASGAPWLTPQMAFCSGVCWRSQSDRSQLT